MEKLTVVLAIFLIVLALLWFFLPFAVFGIKDLLTQILKELRTTNAILAKQFPESVAEVQKIKANEVDYM
jgi:hypothetical protein